MDTPDPFTLHGSDGEYGERQEITNVAYEKKEKQKERLTVYETRKRCLLVTCSRSWVDARRAV